MTDNYICVDNKYYDPYFILEVDHDDDLDYIIKCYKNKARKYHPDKALNEKDKIKNERRFKILKKSLDFIKEKRDTSFINTYSRKKEYKNSKSCEDKKFKDKMELNKFNHEFEEKSYSKYKKKIKKDEKDRDDKEINIINQFESNKFANKKFNLIFEYNNLQNNKKEKQNSNTLIHYTTDGFYGYNTSDLDNYALVRGFNGLLISDDLISSTQFTKNYGNNYSDYNDIFQNHVKNPDKIIKLTKHELEKLNEILNEKKSNIKKASNYIFENESEYENEDYEEHDNNVKNNFEREQKKLYNKNLISLTKEQENNKKIIMNSGIYDRDLIKDAEYGVLDMSPSLMRALDEHYKFKRLN
jgi:hypothetical protein